jgi:hypothetical protein
VVFNRAIVPAGWTKPSVTSLFTSLTPAIHGVLHYEDSFPPRYTGGRVRIAYLVFIGLIAVYLAAGPSEFIRWWSG